MCMWQCICVNRGRTPVQTELVCGVWAACNGCAVVYGLATGETGVPVGLHYSWVIDSTIAAELCCWDPEPCATSHDDSSTQVRQLSDTETCPHATEEDRPKA